MTLSTYLNCFRHIACACPSYVAVWKRVVSFDVCPSPTINPVRFAQAGFFYVGNNHCPDAVKCYACGLTLCFWEPGDDPWVEHAKYDSRCSHLFLNKGWPFLRDVNTRQTPAVDRADNQQGEPTCIICTTDTVSVAFLPCEHACLCRKCGATVKSCPICRTHIMYSIRIILP